MTICKTSSARNKVRNWFKREKRDENILKGKEIVEKEIRKLRRVWRGFSKKDLLERLMERYKVYSSKEELLAAIGYGDIIPVQLGKVLRTELDNIVEKLKGSKDKKPEKKEILEDKESISLSYDGESVVQVKGVKNLAVRIARCCKPLPGENIIGLYYPGQGSHSPSYDLPEL